MKTSIGDHGTSPAAGELRPRARTEGVIVEEMDEETLVYDVRGHRAHCLNAGAALVWRASDGRTSVSDMARLLGGVGLPEDEEVVWMALSRLDRAGLLDEPASLPSQRRRYSRKEMLRTVGSMAGLALVLPAVTSITAPLAAQAASCITAAHCSSLRPPDCTGLPICENRNQSCVAQNKNFCRPRSG
jgi:hypothetical protein